uniref:Phosphodiesterase n=1 Tax=Phallusia mammillata TaxID=59560 RepID=A0A6F9DP32_9ASCI|nr:high affinity cGMP-specific 3',5'-cyclic phosphodiesterase 9A [Phallusia mammillata]
MSDQQQSNLKDDDVIILTSPPPENEEDSESIEEEIQEETEDSDPEEPDQKQQLSENNARLSDDLANSNNNCEFVETQNAANLRAKQKLSSKQSEKTVLINGTNGTSTADQHQEEDFTMPGLEAVYCPKATMRDLAEPMFDVWRLDRDSMVDHIEYMYHDLGIVRAWRIPRATLRMFLLGVRERYQDNPYHNFKHCFCVTQMAYSMVCKLRLRGSVSVDYLGALLTAAVCHDVDHPGLNNAYHSHARTPLAILYNYKSILEQHHFAVTCRILSNKERNIFRNVNNRDEVLTNVGELILATDLARHKDVMETYARNVDDGFDFKNNGHVLSVLKIIIKCADVSNEVRPETVAGPWVERLFAEYSEQSAREKRERLPVTPYMDPDIVNVAESQENFIRGIMLPMYDELCKLIVDARLFYINPLYEALTRYEVQSMRERGI